MVVVAGTGDPGTAGSLRGPGAAGAAGAFLAGAGGLVGAARCVGAAGGLLATLGGAGLLADCAPPTAPTGAVLVLQGEWIMPGSSSSQSVRMRGGAV
jgi:hypothetical protein